MCWGCHEQISSFLRPALCPCRETDTEWEIWQDWIMTEDDLNPEWAEKHKRSSTWKKRLTETLRFPSKLEPWMCVCGLFPIIPVATVATTCFYVKMPSGHRDWSTCEPTQEFSCKYNQHKSKQQRSEITLMLLFRRSDLTESVTVHHLFLGLFWCFIRRFFIEYAANDLDM